MLQVVQEAGIGSTSVQYEAMSSTSIQYEAMSSLHPFSMRP